MHKIAEAIGGARRATPPKQGQQREQDDEKARSPKRSEIVPVCLNLSRHLTDRKHLKRQFPACPPASAAIQAENRRLRTIAVEFRLRNDVTALLPAHQPDQQHAQRKGHKPAKTDLPLRLHRHYGQGPLHRPGKSRVKRTFQRENQSESGQEIGQFSPSASGVGNPNGLEECNAASDLKFASATNGGQARELQIQITQWTTGYLPASLRKYRKNSESGEITIVVLSPFRLCL